VTEIPLAHNRGVTLIDDGDVELVAPYVWKLKRSKKDHIGYAQCNGVYLHRLLLPGAPCVDHIDGDSLNNQRANLRRCTHAENMRNVRPHEGRKYKGVTYRSRNDKWEAYIKPPGVPQVYLGKFPSEEEAARAYDSAAVHHFGEFARLNFPALGDTLMAMVA
jgi:hypothetical protein